MSKSLFTKSWYNYSFLETISPESWPTPWHKCFDQSVGIKWCWDCDIIWMRLFNPHQIKGEGKNDFEEWFLAPQSCRKMSSVVLMLTRIILLALNICFCFSHHGLGPREFYKLSNLTIIFSVICRRIDRRISP